ncbi:hypothetical protein PO124_33225 [Bacillus licheniformis]|nr:hypothetical protein [Bacillus licheniformis]
MMIPIFLISLDGAQGRAGDRVLAGLLQFVTGGFTLFILCSFFLITLSRLRPRESAAFCRIDPKCFI